MRRPLDELNPIVFFVFFILSVGLMMFSVDLVSAAVSFIVSTLVSVYFIGLKPLMKEFAGLILFGVLVAVINPIFVHRGETAIMYVNSQAITFEATMYGLSMAMIILSVFMWCKLFYISFSSDGLQYVMGKYAPKTAVTISIIIRFVPMLWKREQLISENMTAIGENSGIKNKLNIYSGVTSFALENSIETSDSMRARGYGISEGRKRTLFSRYRFRRSDLVFLILCMILFVCVIVIKILWGGYRFYPRIEYTNRFFPILMTSFYSLFLGFPILLRSRRSVRKGK